MFTPKAIQKTLRLLFSQKVTAKGRAYFKNKLVKSLEIDGTSVRAKVQGSTFEPYDVYFEFDDRDRTLDGECNCPYEENCKHMAAVLYALENKLLEETRKQILERIKPNLRSTLSIASSKGLPVKNTTRSLEGTHSGSYRKLPLSEGSFGQLLIKYGSRHFRRLGWNESFEGSFISDNEIELENKSAYGYFNNPKQKIVVKREEEGFFVKCLTCNTKTPTLCTHQQALLEASHHILTRTGFVQGRVSLSSLVVDGTTTGVTKETFDKYFDIKLGHNGFRAEPRHPNMVGKDWIKSTQDIINFHKNERNDIAARHTQSLKDNRKQKFAFFWGREMNHSQSNELVLYFVKGYGLKTKEGIHATDRTFEEIPSGFPEPYQTLGQQLFFEVIAENIPLRFQKIKSFIENNLEELNGIYQYVYNGEVEDRVPKASDTYLIKFHPSTLKCKFIITRKDGLIHLQRQLFLDSQPFDFSKTVYANHVFCATPTTGYLFPNHHLLDVLEMFGKHNTLILPYTDKTEYTRLINDLKKHFDVEIPPELIMEEERLSNARFQILLREAGNFVLFEPRLKYGDYSFNAFDEEEYLIEKKVFRPDQNDQQFLVQFLKNAHPEFDNPIQIQDYVFLDVKEMINNYWFVHFNEACEAAGVELLGVKDLSSFKYSKYRGTTYSHVKSGIDWFEVDMGITFGDEKVKTADWIRALRNKESFVRLKDGSLGILPEEWLKQAQKILAVSEVGQDALKISKYRFNIIEDLFDNLDDKKIIEELRARKKRLAQLDLDKEYDFPDIITAELRAYQRYGFRWLKFLDESQFGGILADDMGLGKTVQVISLLADQIDKEPSLVIVPRSLLFNWAAELDKFCSSLTYIIHHGTGRANVIEELIKYNIIITTYGTAASDVTMLKDFKFNYIVLDESQAIKNPDSKRYKAMRLLQSNNKIAMTGTPIENNTMDLYAQLSFTSPGLLGTKTSFKNNFAIPIDNQGDVEAANLLRKLIHPFLLRRTKEQVATDLPEKTVSVIYCEMGNTQRKLYNNLKQKIKEDIETEVQERGIAKSKFKMLDGLLRLRQMCNSPLLLNQAFTGYNAESVKINILLRHITEELDQHCALIFSQFVSLLTIVRNELDQRGIKYAYLDGSTTKRQKEVNRFSNDDDIKLFLISLKAGNTGMNLTKADYVYILDPWWNPAVEAQAIDRTHRIGQDKQIFAYKLICKDTIEEKILKLQEKKKNLAKDIIRTDENILKSLKKDELLALFD